MYDKIHFLGVFDNGSKIAGIITLIIAVLTFWYNWLKNKRLKNKLRKYLNTELRTIFFNAIIPDILTYDKLANQDYNNELEWKAYDCPVIEQIVIGNKSLEIFQKPESVNLLNMIYSIINRMEKGYSDFTNHIQQTNQNRKKFFDFYFQHRIVELRERVIELVDNECFLDLNIMPKKYEGYLPDLDKIKDSILHKLDQEIVMQILSNEFINLKISNQISKYKYIQDHNARSTEIIKKYLKDKIIRVIPEQHFGDNK